MKKVKRDYKSRMFTMIFSDKKELLGLYNAIADRNYDDPELLTINTLENAIYMSMKNDLSFIIADQLFLYEHQSTYNPNMPLRFLMYIADEYSEVTAKKNLYGKRLVEIETPQFIVFYNGAEKRPERTELKLSDAYKVKTDNPALELKAVVLNINKGYNEELKHLCKTLRDYSEYVQRVRDYRSKGVAVNEAVERTIAECIEEDILKEFLIKNRAEATAVSIYEYNEEEHMRMEREDSYAEGHAEGRMMGRAEEIVRILRKLGKTDDEIVTELVGELKISIEEARKYYAV